MQFSLPMRVNPEDKTQELYFILLRLVNTPEVRQIDPGLGAWLKANRKAIWPMLQEAARHVGLAKAAKTMQDPSAEASEKLLTIAASMVDNIPVMARQHRMTPAYWAQAKDVAKALHDAGFSTKGYELDRVILEAQRAHPPLPGSSEAVGEAHDLLQIAETLQDDLAYSAEEGVITSDQLNHAQRIATGLHKVGRHVEGEGLDKAIVQAVWTLKGPKGQWTRLTDFYAQSWARSQGGLPHHEDILKRGMKRWKLDPRDTKFMVAITADAGLPTSAADFDVLASTALQQSGPPPKLPEEPMLESDAWTRLNALGWHRGAVYFSPAHLRNDDTFLDAAWYKVLDFRHDGKIAVAARDEDGKERDFALDPDSIWWKETPHQLVPGGEFPEPSGSIRVPDLAREFDPDRKRALAVENRIIRLALQHLSPPGIKWTVQGGSGTSWGWTRIKATPRTAVADDVAKLLGFYRADDSAERYRLRVPADALAYVRSKFR